MSLDPASPHLEPLSHETLASLDDPFYYLDNFRRVLDWVSFRYADLLNETERQFSAAFYQLPRVSQALLVRLVMRKGEYFRSDKLNYHELGASFEAAEPLVSIGWLKYPKTLEIDTLFSLYTWSELKRWFPEPIDRAGVAKMPKKAALAELRQANRHQWPAPEQGLYQVTIKVLVDRFRLMFFGNPHQSWSEFVLTQLGRLKFEAVAINARSRPFQTRQELDAFLDIQHCREALHADEPLAEIEARLPSSSASPWLRYGRDKLLFKLGRAWEREGKLERARRLYEQCTYPGARARLLRVMERQGEVETALRLAEQAEHQPESEEERQKLQRLMPRLHRKLGLRLSKRRAPAQPNRIDLCLPKADSVEVAVGHYFSEPGSPVWYVENTLLMGLFGLLCWDAIHAPVPGAFFHPFQVAPADLYWPDFYQRRADRFERRFRDLEEGSYIDLIWDRYFTKWGLQSPFVYWDALPESLIEDALACIPAEHLTLFFERLLRDVKANRSGLPDLIQLWPEKKRYRLLEVKGPGDRLQDNQRRWLSFFTEHQIPASVCYVQWEETE